MMCACVEMRLHLTSASGSSTICCTRDVNGVQCMCRACMWEKVRGERPVKCHPEMGRGGCPVQTAQCANSRRIGKMCICVSFTCDWGMFLHTLTNTLIREHLSGVAGEHVERPKLQFRHGLRSVEPVLRLVGVAVLAAGHTGQQMGELCRR